MGFGETCVELKSGIKFGKSVWIVLLLPIGLTEKKAHVGIIGILLEEPTKNRSGQLRLARTDEGRAPSEEKAGIARR